MKRFIFIVSLSLNILLIAGYSTKHYYYQYYRTPTAIDSTYIKWGIMRRSVLESLPIDSTNIVFVGNSLTEWFPLAELFPELPIKNRGIVSNRTYQIVDRLPAIVAAHPKKLFLEMGINDLANQISIDTILANYQKAIRLVKTGSPHTALIIQSVLPVTGWAAPFNQSIVQVNDSLQHYCNLYHLPYVDVHKDLLYNNELNPAYTSDGVHLNATGYAIWKRNIKELLY